MRPCVIFVSKLSYKLLAWISPNFHLWCSLWHTWTAYILRWKGQRSRSQWDRMHFLPVEAYRSTVHHWRPSSVNCWRFLRSKVNVIARPYALFWLTETCVVQPSVISLSINMYFAWHDISELGRGISVQLGTNIYHMSRHYWKGCQGQRSRSRSYWDVLWNGRGIIRRGIEAYLFCLIDWFSWFHCSHLYVKGTAWPSTAISMIWMPANLCQQVPSVFSATCDVLIVCVCVILSLQTNTVIAECRSIIWDHSFPSSY